MAPFRHGCAFLRTSPSPWSAAVLACATAGLAARTLTLAAVWAHAGAAAADAPAVGAPEAQRLRARAVARAGDVAALVSLTVLMYAGFFRFPRDLGGPWREFSSVDYGKWLLEAMTLPQLRGQHIPHRYSEYRHAKTDSARAFLGYGRQGADESLYRGLLLGPLPLAACAALALARLLHSAQRP